jgi:LacI family transcriptional regulator
MKEAGLKPAFILADQVDGIGDRVVRRLHASKRPVAVFTLNNVMSMNLLQRLQREGIRVPEDVALIGFDDFELASLLAVPLTAVRQPAEELGRSATRLLLDWIRSGAKTREALSEQIVLPTELVIRRSCGCDPPKSVRVEGRGRRMLSETSAATNLDNFAYSSLAT